MRLLRTFFLLAVSVVALFLFARSSFWALQEIRVEGNRSLTPKEVVGLSGIVPGQNLLTLREREVRQRLLLHPRIKGVDLRYHLPDTVVIEIEEREPLGVIPVADSFWEVDGEGILLGTKKTWTREDPPLLTGASIPREKLLPGQKLALPEVTGLLAVAAALPPKIRRVVREIHFDRREGISLYTSGEVRVYLGQPEDLETKIVLFWAVYQQQSQEGKISRLAYVDVSHPKAPTLKYVDEGE